MDWKKAGFTPHYILKIFLLTAVFLTALMAVFSDYNRHPDEIHHFLASQYYTNHFLPPEIGDESVRETYSVYGVSYLNYHWAEYFTAGKFAAFFNLFLQNPLLATRFFNVFLFLSFSLFFIFKVSDERLLLASPLIVSPQIWYVFSYSNNDAFALFISLIVSYQIAYENSLLNIFLKSAHFKEKLAGGILFAFLVGLLLVCKTNYYAFLFFAGLWLLIAFPPINFNICKKYAFIVLLALSFFGFRIGLDFYVNGETNYVGISYISYFSGNFEARKNKLLAYQEEIAEKPYKPSTIENDLANTDRALKLKAKGLSFSEIFTVWDWHNISFASFTGVYGYMTVFAKNSYYLAMKILYLTFGLYLLITILWNSKLKAVPELLAVVFSSLVTIFISAYLSWSYAFQAQGRYLFPLLGIFAVLVYKNRKSIHNSAVYFFIGATFLLSVYSFVFVALKRINIG